MSIEIKRFVSALDQAIQQQMVNESIKLGKGQCKDHEEYKKITGRIQGMDASISVAREMLRKIEIDEDDVDKGKKRQGGKK